VYLENISVRFSPNIVQKIKDDCRAYRQENFSFNPTNVSEVYIGEVNLVCAYHNGWNFVNKAGIKNTIGLVSEPNSKEIYMATSPLACTNIFHHQYAS
jgi:hypothetical protein